MLCGSSLGMGTLCDDGKWRQLRRHRLFETNVPVIVPSCVHRGEPIGVYGTGGAQRNTVANGGRNRGYMGGADECRRAMELPDLTKRELADAIPPPYTELLGLQILPVAARASSRVRSGR